MRNPFRRLLRSAEYRKLDERISELSDLYTVLAERFTKWDARQRQRARRSLDDPGTRDHNDGGGADGELRLVAPAPVVGDEAPKLTKEQLRANARARGLM